MYECFWYQGVSQALFDDALFSIHVNFPITSRCVLKATVHRKKLLIEKITMSRNAKYFKSFKRIKVKLSNIRALWKKKNVQKKV